MKRSEDRGAGIEGILRDPSLLDPVF